MKREILDRYSHSPEGYIILDIAAGKVEDLYNDFDKHAPYVKKELDQDLVDYITESVNEIGKENFLIQFRFSTPAKEALQTRITSSIHNYFFYLKELELREQGRMVRTSLILFALGIVILVLSVWINRQVADMGAFFTHVFAEGFNVAAWVSLWNAIATFLIHWSPHRKKIRMYKRIARAKIVFMKE